MKEQEKQIEVKKLVNIITKTYPNQYSIEYPAKAIRLANELLEHYQPKLPKDSVVLTEKQHEVAMIHQYDVGYGFGYEKGSKETAEKIYLQAKTIVDKTKHIIQGREYLHLDALKEIIKQFDVNIKENEDENKTSR